MERKIELLPHNQKLYTDIVKKMIEGYKSIFYSEGTGLGKSFIFMKLVLDFFMDKKILYVSYRNEIWSNIQSYKEYELIKDVIIDYKCFADFNSSMKISTYLEKYDIIFIDECHHMLSDIQGKNIFELCKRFKNKGKLVFGFTATPFVNGSWVDKEYFDCSCYGLDNFEAIEAGLLPKINLALGINNTDEIPDNLRAQYSITGSKSLLEQVLDDYSEVTHWLAYFSTVKDLEANEKELQKLFPDYKVFKIYEGVDNIDQMKQEYNNYEGKAILLSVSMLLEGTHGLRAGGILLFRNVIFAHTYAQIMGRLNKIGNFVSPIMIDITNSIINLNLNSNFTKSDRDDNRRKVYEKKDIFDVTSKGYRYVELIEQMRILKIQNASYRGITWIRGNDRSLSRALGKEESTFNSYKKRHPDITEEQYIDYCLDRRDKEEVSYRGITWIKGNFQSLCKALGRSANTFYNYKRNHPNATEEDYINFVLDGGEKVSYRGITWIKGSARSLSEALGKNKSSFTAYRKYKPNISEEQYIDYCLDSYKEVSYRGITWIKGNGPSLSEALGRGNAAFYNYKKRHPNATEEQYIDYCLDSYKEVSYRGITWIKGSTRSLSEALGRGKTSFCCYKKRHPNATEEQYIDYCLNSYKEVSYRDITWIKGNDKSLSRALGKGESAFSSYKRNHPNATEEDYINFVLDGSEKVSYRGITWIKGNFQSLCKALGKGKTAFKAYKRKHPNATEENYIDYCLDKSRR